jgi:hypothetical protein
MDDLVVGQRGRGLVEHEYLGLGGQAAGDHHQATLSHAETGHLRGGIDVDLQRLVHDLPRAPVHRPLVDERSAPPRVLETEEHVFRHRQVRHVGQLLVHE